MTGVQTCALRSHFTVYEKFCIFFKIPDVVLILGAGDIDRLVIPVKTISPNFMLKKVLYILRFFLVLAYLVAAIVYFSDYSDSTRCSGLEVRVEGKTKHAFMQKVDVE